MEILSVIRCPHCLTDVLPQTDGTCPSCLKDTRALAENKPAEATPTAQEVVVVGSRRKVLWDCIVTTIFLGMITTHTLGGEPGPGSIWLLALLGTIYVITLRQLIHPPRLGVKRGYLSIESLAKEITSPAPNVAVLGFAGKKLHVRFASLDQVEPEASRPELERTHAKSGVHVQIGGDFFSREELDRVRRALGMEGRDPDERAARIEEFHRVLLAQTPRTIATSTIIGINLVMALIVALGEHSFTPNVAGLIKWGANYGPRTLSDEWWRLFTSTFLHLGVFHLVFNMIALWDVGRLVERLVGSTGFVLLYVLSGLLGSVASVVWYPVQVSAGASGAIFGLFGALFGFTFRSKGTIPAEELKHLRTTGLSFVIFNCVFGLTMPGIDLAAHLGGLVAGLASGILLGRPIAGGAASGRVPRNLALVASGLLGLGLSTCVLPEAPADVLGEISRFAAVEERVLHLFTSTTARASIGESSDRALADLVENEILPPWRAASERFRSMTNVPTTNAPIVANLSEYMKLRQESWEIIVNAIRNQDPKKMDEFKAIWAEAEKIAGDLTAGSGR